MPVHQHLLTRLGAAVVSLAVGAVALAPTAEAAPRRVPTKVTITQFVPSADTIEFQGKVASRVRACKVRRVVLTLVGTGERLGAARSAAGGRWLIDFDPAGFETPD